MTIAIDLSGQVFGRLTVLSRATVRLKGNAVWVCRCSCGTEKEVRGTHLRNGDVKSCGCARGMSGRSNLKSRSTHGMTGTSTHNAWRSLKSRCENPNSDDYAEYGGRGIKVCERWQSFGNFLADMGVRPLGTSIDRVDVNGNYEPGNCRWATATEQSRNRRSCRLTEQLVREIKGRREHGEPTRSIAARLGVSKGHVVEIIRGDTWRGVE